MKANIFDQQYIKEWRKLGFFYYRDDINKQWLFNGPQKSFLSFADTLTEYTKMPLHKNFSEHQHFGPQEYLKVITSKQADINSEGLNGSLEDIERFANLLKKEVVAAKPNDKILIGKQYSEDAEYCILITITEDNFDPSSLDSSINR